MTNKLPEEQEAKRSMLASKEALQQETPVDADTLATNISQNVIEKISTMMDKKFEELSTTLNNITTLESNMKRITETESRISVAEDTAAALESRLADLESKVYVLTEMSIDKEGHSHRDNIVIYNLKETAEGQQPVKFFESWLPLLDLETKWGVIKIGRAHRTFGPQTPNRPQAVVIKLHNSRDKLRILAAVKEKGQLTYEGQTVFIRQDLAAGVKEMRRAFNGVCERLISKGIRFSMRFPATLNFSCDFELLLQTIANSLFVDSLCIGMYARQLLCVGDV